MWVVVSTDMDYARFTCLPWCMSMVVVENNVWIVMCVDMYDACVV